MSRSAADATRFTATFPHAYSKPHPNRKGPPPPSSQSPPWRSSPSNTPSPNPLDLRNPFSLTSSSSSSSSSNRFPSSPSDSAPTPLDETPRQKVARLRAARAAARAADIPLWDRVVLTGRNVADRAHRITALGLIGLTVVSGGVTLFALTDMIIYNRRKRRAFYADEAAAQHVALLAAIELERAGQPLDEDQALLLNRERMRVRDEDEKKRKQAEGGLVRSWGRWLVSGLRGEQVVAYGIEPAASGEERVHEKARGGGVMEAVREMEMGLEGEMAVQEEQEEEVEERGEGGRRKQRQQRQRGGGGPLDQMAERMAGRVSALGKRGEGGLFGWERGK